MLAGSGSRCRDQFQRYYLNGETTSAIAETMRSTPATVLVFLHKCRKRALAAYRALTERG
jgi:DNA-directed RNA polymerase specialized sigma24 family protein